MTKEEQQEILTYIGELIHETEQLRHKIFDTFQAVGNINIGKESEVVK